MWEFLSKVEHYNVSIAVVQESRMKQNELDAFTATAWRKGYKVFIVQGPLSSDRYGHDKPNGGVLVMVKRGIPHSMCCQVSMPGGQACAVWVGGLLLVGIYSPPNEHQDDFLETLHSHLAGFAHCPFLYVGDWNLTPSENSFIDACGGSVVAAQHPFHAACCTPDEAPQAIGFHPAVVELSIDAGRVEPSINDAHPDMDDSIWLPTRWNGDRCVDYAVSSLPVHCMQVSLGTEKISDHKILKVQCAKCLPHAPSFKLRKVDPYPKPDGMLLAEWRNILSAVWQEQHWTPPEFLITQESVDALWHCFNECLENTFRIAYAKARGLRPKSFPKSRRPRSSNP